MYVMRIKDAVLTEMTPREYSKRLAEHDDVYRISAEEARRRVKDGCVHETGLWVDSLGKVRYARAEPA